MQTDLFNDFRLVGGTALSLHLGHRMSVDIDLFTDATYGSIDFDRIDKFLMQNYAYVDTSFGMIPGMGRSYFIGADKDDTIKLDVYYTNDNFIQPPLVVDGVSMASIDEVVSMKVDVVQRVGRKKDFWDLHQLIDFYTLDQMLALHRLRHEWTHDEALIISNFTNFEKADEDFDPICLHNKVWEFIKDDIADFVGENNNGSG
jgi:hypothetical protein